MRGSVAVVPGHPTPQRWLDTSGSLPQSTGELLVTAAAATAASLPHYEFSRAGLYEQTNPLVVQPAGPQTEEQGDQHEMPAALSQVPPVQIQEQPAAAHTTDNTTATEGETTARTAVSTSACQY